MIPKMNASLFSLNVEKVTIGSPIVTITAGYYPPYIEACLVKKLPNCTQPGWYAHFLEIILSTLGYTPEFRRFGIRAQVPDLISNGTYNISGSSYAYLESEVRTNKIEILFKDRLLFVTRKGARQDSQRDLLTQGLDMPIMCLGFAFHVSLKCLSYLSGSIRSKVISVTNRALWGVVLNIFLNWYPSVLAINLFKPSERLLFYDMTQLATLLKRQQCRIIQIRPDPLIRRTIRGDFSTNSYTRDSLHQSLKLMPEINSYTFELYDAIDSF